MKIWFVKQGPTHPNSPHEFKPNECIYLPSNKQNNKMSDVKRGDIIITFFDNNFIHN